MYHRERAQPRQHKVARGRDPARDPQPGGARRQSELDDEVPRRGCKVADNDDVRAQPAPHRLHPRDDPGQWVLRTDEERLDRCAAAEERVVGRGRGRGCALHDGVRDTQVGQGVGRR